MNKDKVIEQLKNQGFRITKQRKVLIDIILDGNCSCYKEVYILATKKDPGIGISTVYRTVEALETVGALKRGSAYQFIMTLPKGYDTEVGELGDTLSGGEKQRIGIARAFLHDAPMLLMDEPTSNLDSLNEGITLKSLKESAQKKTVVLVSHRKSTMNVADVVYEMANGRLS